MIGCNMKSFRCLHVSRVRKTFSSLNLDSDMIIVEGKKSAKEESSLLPTEPVTEAQTLIKGITTMGMKSSLANIFANVAIVG
jgi:hypothetical protein